MIQSAVIQEITLGGERIIEIRTNEVEHIVIRDCTELNKEYRERLDRLKTPCYVELKYNPNHGADGEKKELERRQHSNE